MKHINTKKHLKININTKIMLQYRDVYLDNIT